MLHAQKRCQARMLFRGDTTIISPSSPGSLSGLQGCNFEMDFTAANSKMAQFVFSISASSPITMEICIRASVTGCIKYAAGLNAQNGELQNLRTAANVGLGEVGGVSKAVGGYLLLQTHRPPFSPVLAPKARGEDVYAPLSFPRNPGLPILQRTSQMVNGTEVCT